jgi:hypothetical protein
LIAKTLEVHPSTVDQDIAGNPASLREKANHVSATKSSDAGNPALELTGAQAAKLVDRAEIPVARRRCSIPMLCSPCVMPLVFPRARRVRQIWRIEMPPLHGDDGTMHAARTERLAARPQRIGDILQESIAVTHR